MTNIIDIYFDSVGSTATAPSKLWQWSKGQVVRINGIDLPTVYQVHFSSNPTLGTAEPVAVSGNMVSIPDIYLTTGEPVYLFIWLSDETSAETIRKGTIYVAKRSQPSGEYDPTAEQQTIIDGLIGSINTAVDTAEGYANSAQTYSGNAATSATEALNAKDAAQGYAEQASQTAQGVEILVNRAEDAADDAETAKQDVEQLKQAVEGFANDAESAKTDAETARGEAQGFAQTASAKASEALQSASQASQSATTATAQAQTATAKATEASQSAETATTKASEASASATTATTKASKASASASTATTAKNDAVTAKNAAVTAKTGAETARTGAEAAAQSVSASAAQIATNTSDISDLKEAIGGGATVINTTEESPTQGYWSMLGGGVLARTDGSTTYYTLENPLNISSLKDGTTFTIKASVNGSYGAYVADANMIVLDYVNGSNAAERGYSVTSNLQEISFTKTAAMKYVVSDIRTTKYTGMSDFSITGKSNNNIVILDNRVSELEDAVFPDKDTYPTQTIIKDGGFCKIFQTIGVVGDSLSSGSMAPPSDSELDEDEEDTTDYLWYSWIQYMARYSGLTAYNFSMGGLSARGLRYGTTNPNVQEILANLRSNDKKCKAYYVALAHNDYNYAQDHPEYIIGTSADCNLTSPDSNTDTFYGNYAWVVSQIKAVQPNAKIFLITAKRQAVYGTYNTAIREMVSLFNTYYNNSNVYLIDMETYCPTIETDWEYSGGHGNAMGYLNYSYQVSSYTDWIIRHNRSDFKYVQFIGTGIL